MEKLTPQQRKAMVQTLGNDTKLKLEEAQFHLQMDNMRLQEQEIRLRSQIIEQESLEGYLRTIQSAEELNRMTDVDSEVAAAYVEYAILMIKTKAPNVDALKKHIDSQKSQAAAESLKKSGLILND